MISSSIQTANFSALPRIRKQTASIEFYRLSALLFWLLALVGLAHAQTDRTTDREVVISGVVDNIVIGTGDTIRITGTVKQGAIAFGSDVIVEGSVEGDVAAIGGSVIQSAGAKITGDVIVIGGTYQHVDKAPQRDSAAMTMMVAGHQQELRSIIRTPSQLLRPSWSPGYLGSRLLSILFWFIVSLALTAALPGAISRGVTRIQLTSLRVALIGFVGSVVIAAGVEACLWALPQPVSVLVLIMGLLLMLLALLFGRVVLAAATGKWLQRKYVPFGKNSESVALLLGTGFWVLLTSLPYVWPFMAAFILIISFGLALTARYRKTVSV
jgi:hypothetical protein